MRNTIMVLALCLLCSNAFAQKRGITGPHLIVYKTKKNYNNHVAVILSADKSKIVSYPDPADIKASGNLAAPTVLDKGYLLDNRGGIGMNTAFLKMTNEEYANLPKAPTTAELYRMIIDKDPIAMLCDCGKKYNFKNPVTEINGLIDNNKFFGTCKVAKKSPVRH